MACGTAVVSSDCPNGPREILEGGRHGILVPVGDPALFAQAIESQLDTPKKSTAIQRAQAFGIDIALERYAEVLKL
jgi:glycosyltransferase involved in cell wall biosynthesis